MNTESLPKNLLQVARYFADIDVCVDFVAKMRWPDGVTCPHCQGNKVSYLTSRRIWKCMAKDCHKQFSVKTFSVFEDSPIALDKWLTAIWLIVDCKNGISSYEIHRNLGVTQKSAWFMLHRIRLALKNSSWEKFGGGGQPVEGDETFIGGKVKNMHRNKVAEKGLKTGRGAGKTIVIGMLDRESRQVRARVIPDVKREVLQPEILNAVEKGAIVYTDGAVGYHHLATQEYIHQSVDHLTEYVRGQVHTQGIDNFWSLLKRGLNGTYLAVEPFHLDRYVDEQLFRYNNRATIENPLTDLDRFAYAVSQIAGKRLTYSEFTGKDEKTENSWF